MLLSNKNIQEPIRVRFQTPRPKLRQQQEKQCLNFSACQCPFCQTKLKQAVQPFKSTEKDLNKFQQFLKAIPSNFPLYINPTTVYNFEQGYHMHYSNGSRTQNKSFICKTKTSKLLINYPIAHNIRIFGNNFSKIVAKYQTMAFLRRLQQNQSTLSKKSLLSDKSKLSYINRKTQKQSLNPQDLKRESQNSSNITQRYQKSKVLYIQAYSHQIPLKIYYEKDLIKFKLDPILKQYLNEQVEHFQQKDHNKTYTINEEFWQWVFMQYGEQIFGYFVSQFYARVYKHYSKNIIQKAIFYWVLQKPKKQFGQNTKVVEQLGKHKYMLQAQYFIAKMKKLSFKLKLVNLKNVQILYYRNLKSFQQQYQELILQKIKSNQSNSQSSPQIINNKLALMNKKNHVYSNRLNTFQSKVRDLFLKQQNIVLNKVEQQRQFGGKQDSNKLARLLLPNMGQYSSIREILNDQHAFQKLVLFGQRKKERQRLQRARQNLLGEQRGKSIGQRLMYEQSRSKRSHGTSSRIRIRTQY